VVGLALAVTALLSACTSDTTAPQNSACEPLQTSAPVQIQLTTVLGAGKDAHGTLYVADTGTARSSGERVFISDGAGLRRVPVVGSGSQGGGANADYALSFDDGTTRGTLIIHVAASKVTSMALGAVDSGKGSLSDAGTSSEPLTVLDNASVTSLTVHDLKNAPFIEYVAHTASSDTLLVLRPTYDWSYDDFRVFFGPRAGLQEQKVQSVSRARDGGSTVIVFSVGDATYTAHFPVVSTGTTFMPGPATLDTGKATLPLTLDAAKPSSLTDATFHCSG
jgi:hypothetical protein